MKNSAFVNLAVLILLLVNFMVSLELKAVDLGVWGTSFEIAEEDFEENIVKQLELIGEDKLQEHQELIKDKMVKRIKRPRPVKNISIATAPSRRTYDPSFVVDEDIKGAQGQLVYAKGTKINPLEQKAFDEIWLFIDGDDEAQVVFARNYQEPEANIKTIKTKKIILTSGAPGEQKDGSFFYFDQGGVISEKLNITKVPSVIRQTPNDTQILIEEIALQELAEGVVYKQEAAE